MAPQEQSNNRRRLIPIILVMLILPFLCAGTAYASGLSVDTQWFSVQFGPPSTDGDPNGDPPTVGLPPILIFNPNPESPDEPDGPGGPGGPGDPGDPGTPGDPAASQNCFLGLLCVTAKYEPANGNTNGVGVNDNGLETGDVESRDPDDGALNVDVTGTSGDGAAGLDVDGPGEVDLGLGTGGDNGLDLSLPVLGLGN